MKFSGSTFFRKNIINLKKQIKREDYRFKWTSEWMNYKMLNSKFPLSSKVLFFDSVIPECHIFFFWLRLLFHIHLSGVGNTKFVFFKRF